MDKIPVRRKMDGCCGKELFWEDVALRTLVKTCDRYPAVVALRISCPNCHRVVWNLEPDQISIARRLNAIEHLDNSIAEALAEMFCERFPGVELMQPARFFGYELRLAVANLHRRLEHIDTVEAFEQTALLESA